MVAVVLKPKLGTSCTSGDTFHKVTKLCCTSGDAFHGWASLLEARGSEPADSGGGGTADSGDTYGGDIQR